MQLNASDWAVLSIAGVIAIACSRKAPGPMECHDFALSVAGVAAAEQRAGQLDPIVRRAIEEVTVRCLTMPYDRELLLCVDRGQELRGCFAAFESRHPGRVERARATRPP